jgi:putative ABC transport system permease protein
MALERDLETMPGVEAVAISRGRPAPADYSFTAPQPWLSDTPGATAVEIAVNIHSVRADYFELYRIPILAGRAFERTDDPRDVIVGERFANLIWPEDSPLGRGFSRGATRYRVIGVARETTFPTLDPQEDRAEFYEPFNIDRPSLDLSVRCGMGCPDPALIADRIEAAHPGVRPIGSLRFLEDRYQLELEQPRTTAKVGLVFAALAVIVAAGGLFAVLSYAVSRRRREFGIRTALGASPGSLRQLVLGDGLLTAALGIAAGAAVGWMAVRTFSAVHYGVTPADPLSWAAVITAIAVTTLAAAWRPAQQATRANPVELLRDE